MELSYIYPRVYWYTLASKAPLSVHGICTLCRYLSNAHALWYKYTCRFRNTDHFNFICIITVRLHLCFVPSWSPTCIANVILGPFDFNDRTCLYNLVMLCGCYQIFWYLGLASRGSGFATYIVLLLLMLLSWHACTAAEVQIGLVDFFVCGCFQVVSQHHP